MFALSDFRVFEISGFGGRMQSIREQVRPKLTGLGDSLAPQVSRLIKGEVFPHVAKHARRTVNPPEDTWVAFGSDRRGYKKHAHFKVAVSKNCVRCLFEVGPEHEDKRGWARRWERRPADLIAIVKRGQDIGWFKDEHDEDPAMPAKQVTPAEIRMMLGELTRRRDGQLVLGRRLSRAEVTGMTPAAFQKAALDVFRVLAPLYRGS